jgi:4'-phosphopantetheinyl transferase
MDVYWLEQSEAEVPGGQEWLSSREAVRLQSIRVPNRRKDWLLGRWTAKNAVALCLGFSTESQALRDIEIWPAASGAPEVFVGHEPAAITISLSHRAGVGACVVAPYRVALGCDLEMIEPHSSAFASDYFAAEEQAMLALAEEADRSRLLTLLWSAKESALKALQEGLRLDTRSVIVSLPELSHPVPSSAGLYDWNPLQVRTANEQILSGWWGQSGRLVRTIIASPPPNLPVVCRYAASLACVSNAL